MKVTGALMYFTCPVQDNPKQRAAAQQINGWSDNPENVDISAVSVLDDDGASGVGAAAAAAVSVALARSWASAASQKQVSFIRETTADPLGPGFAFCFQVCLGATSARKRSHWEPAGSCVSKCSFVDRFQGLLLAPLLLPLSLLKSTMLWIDACALTTNSFMPQIQVRAAQPCYWLMGIWEDHGWQLHVNH